MARLWLVLLALLALAACATDYTTVMVSGYTTAATIVHAH
jgi:hypothetical protein